MIEVCRLCQRRIDPDRPLPKQLEQVKLFCTSVGHGVGTVDFVEKVMEVDEKSFQNILENSGEYTRFKLGNLTKYFEVEVYKEHVQRLRDDMADSPLKDLLCSLKEGYFVLRKSI